MFKATRLSYAHPITSEFLFESIDFSIVGGETVALVGPNGCGKSTLLELMCCVRTPDSGNVVFEQGVTWAYLRQETPASFGISVSECAASRVSSNAVWSAANDAYWMRLCHQFDISEEVSQLDSTYASLGQIQRVSVARAMASHADVLLLDEPTNNLDRETIEVLESLLTRHQHAVLMVCHDRALIDVCADRLLSMERDGLLSYPGGYSDYLEQRERKLATRMDSYKRGQKENKRLKSAAEEKARKAAKITKKKPGNNYSKGAKPHFGLVEKRMHRKARAVMKRAERAIRDSVSKPFEDHGSKLTFPVPPSSGDVYVSVSQVSMSFDQELFRGLSFQLARGSRVAIVGPNGAGKSTLMKAVLGEVTLNEGRVDIASRVKMATLTQARNALDPEAIPVDALQGEETLVRILLGRLGVRGGTPMQKANTLSVGERTKVELVGLLTTPAHVLVLDEPTNHLDIEAMEALEDALKEFTGAILFAAHDRRFVENVATEVIELGS